MEVSDLIKNDNRKTLYYLQGKKPQKTEGL